MYFKGIPAFLIDIDQRMGAPQPLNPGLNTQKTEESYLVGKTNFMDCLQYSKITELL